MKAIRIMLAVAVVGGLAGLAYVAQQAEPAGAKMVAAANKFLDSLSKEQRGRATFDFDSKERTNWHFIPLQDKERKSTRKGLPLQDMSAEQKKLALDLLGASTSSVGKEQATTIMSLEAILREQEKKGAMVREPEWYFFTLFGTPGKTGKWGLRVEGHHLSLNFALEGTEVVSATPFFYGSNPATIVGGPKKGKRPLEASEQLAFDLVNALDADQKKTALQEKAFPEVKPTITPKVDTPVGLAAAKMTAPQKGILMKLIQAYTGTLPPEVAAAEMKLVQDGGVDSIFFAYQGGTEKGQKHSYRVQSPTFVIEFLNEQADSAGNVANHIHSAWRHIKGDFGLK
jgi:hypothetical protein